MKIALLSNINIDIVCKLLIKEIDVFEPQGYGNAFSLLLNKESELSKFSAQAIFFIVDISELIGSAFTYEESVSIIDEWFSTLNYCIDKKKQYFISDVVLRTEFSEDLDEMLGVRIEAYWLTKLSEAINKNTNIHRFNLREIVMEIGKPSFFSEKLWYMGKVPFTSKGCKIIAEKVLSHVELLQRKPKKVLVLDLDNTIWGGIVGELGIEGIQLSDDKIGAIYRDSQRIIKQMQKHGVILAINSKNNWNDAIEIIQNHPHMVLREDDFAAMRINWETKPENMQELARELNLGLDSFVFIDDMIAEREAIKSLLPMVEVPDFPKSLDDLPDFFREIYKIFFKKISMTEEDSKKTQQYRENAQRNELETNLDFDSFLRNLQICIEPVEFNDTTMKRLFQILQKTNQFNLTTRRYSEEVLTGMGQSGWKIYLFRAADRFGDYGIISAVLVNLYGNVPVIDSFVMSCRTMGKRIENYIVEFVEKDMIKQGYALLRAEYIPTEKNLPVKNLFEDLGYKVIDNNSSLKRYEIDLTTLPIRSYCIVNKNDEERIK